jgi:hypothetical protein
MYDAAQNNNEENFNKQYACVTEHLNRGLKDFIIYICSNFYTNILHRILDYREHSINRETYLILKKIYHAFKNLVVKIRIGGQDVQHINEHETVWLAEVLKIIEQFSNLCKGNINLNNLYVSFASIVVEEITKKIHI